MTFSGMPGMLTARERRCLSKRQPVLQNLRRVGAAIEGVSAQTLALGQGASTHLDRFHPRLTKEIQYSAQRMVTAWDWLGGRCPDRGYVEQGESEPA